jgi:DNA-binding SARP family transcriptional activator/tetratricopeptide (TPR) repeat protein
MKAEFGLLGDVEARIGGRLVDLGHARQRCVLAVLLVEVNRAVSPEQLLDRVWAHRPPQRVRNVLSGYLSRLRQALAAADEVRIERRPDGYVLTADPTSIDLHRFRALVAQARAAGASDDAAAPLLDQALRLWRGEPFVALDTPWLNGVREALMAERRTAELECNDLALAAGRHAEVLTDIAAAVDRSPLDERLAGQLMVALYRSGRQADASAVFRTTRQRLVDELGADPGPALRQLHQRMLDGDLTLTVDRLMTSPSVPRQLPAPPRAFAGRERELAALDTLLAGTERSSQTVVISALSGIGGIGKTALALQWARRVSHRFPDGQLYVNLRGFDPSGVAVPAGEAVRGFLEALGIPAQQHPSGLDAQIGLYRNLLADRRMLVVLDNARTVEQVRPLLPGTARSVTVVTSRSRLTGLVETEGATPLGLDVLGPDDARALLERRLGAGRLDAEPQATMAVIAFCGRLPLALSIVAARAATRRDLPLAALSDQLHDVRERLDALEVGDPSIDVRAVFSWSYTALAPEAARVFRLLGLHPGPAMSTAAVGSIAGRPEWHARATLAELTTANLVSEPEPGRYTLHDLVRAYAAELVATTGIADEHSGARQRMFDHYLHAADEADRLIYPHRDPIDLPRPRAGLAEEHLTDARHAVAWFSREGPVLLAIARQAQSFGLDAYAGHLTWAMVNFLDRRGLWADWIEVQIDVLQAARSASDLPAQAVAHRGLQHGYMQLGRFDVAEAHGGCALELYRRLGDRASEAQTHLALGAVATRRGDDAAGLAEFLRAQSLYDAIGHLAGSANALNNAGWAHAMLGDFDKTVLLCRQAAEIQQAIGDRYLLGTTWDSLGYAHHHLGHHGQAISCYRSALELVREQGDRYFEAETLTHLGDTHAAAGDVDAAREARRAAMHIYEELGHSQAGVLRTMVSVHSAETSNDGGAR